MSELFKSGIIVSKNNSTTIPLAANATFIGAIDDVTSYEEIDINLDGGPSNAPGSLYFEFSTDGSNWDVSVLISGTQLTGPNIIPLPLRVILPYFRVRYVNGTTPQTSFRLTVCYHRTSGSRLTRFLSQPIDTTESVDVTKSITMASRQSDGSYQFLTLNASNGLIVDGSAATQPVKMFSSTGSSTSVAGSTSLITLLAANTSRLGATVFNDSTANIFVNLGNSASMTNYTVRMKPLSYFETPFGYTGIITAVFDAANGFARITEIT